LKVSCDIETGLVFAEQSQNKIQGHQFMLLQDSDFRDTGQQFLMQLTKSQHS